MSEQLDVLCVRSPPNVVNANHEMLAVEPDTLLPINDLSLASRGDKRKLLSCGWRTQPRTNVVGSLWRDCEWKVRGHGGLTPHISRAAPAACAIEHKGNSRVH